MFQIHDFVRLNVKHERNEKKMIATSSQRLMILPYEVDESGVGRLMYKAWLPEAKFCLEHMQLWNSRKYGGCSGNDEASLWNTREDHLAVYQRIYRGSRKKPKEDKELGSLLHSIKDRLFNSISICRHLGQNASGEAFKQDAANVLLPPREPTGKSVAIKSSLETSSVPSKEHLLLKDSKPLSPVLLNSSPIESQSSVSRSSPPENLTTGRCHSLPQQRAPSYPSHPRDPVACPPSMPDPSMTTTNFERKILATSRSHILPGLTSPMPTTPGTNLSRRPTSTTPGLNYSSRSISTRPELDHFSKPTSNTPGLNHLSRSTSISRGLEHLSRPTSTTSGLDPFSRPTSTIPGLEHSSRTISGPFMYKITSRTVCHSTSSPDEPLQEDLSLTIHKTSYWIGSTDRQRVAGTPLPSALLYRRCLKFKSDKDPLDLKTKGFPELCSPKPLLPHLVKSQPLSPKFSWSQTPSETRIHAKAHDPYSLSKLPCDSAPIRDNGASRLIPSRAKFIVSPKVQQLEHHLLKKYRESRCDLQVMVKRSLEAFNKQTFKSWGLQGQGPVVHLQGDYISPELQEQTEEPGGVCYHVSLDLQQAPERDMKIKVSSVESQTTQNSPSVLQPATLREVPSSNNSVPSEAPTSAQPFNVLNMKKATTLPYPQSSNASLSWESTHDSMIEMASSLGEPIQQAPERDKTTKASSVESQTTQNSPVLQPTLLREVQPNNNSVTSAAPTTAQAFNVTSMSTPKCLVGRAWHRDTVVRSSAEYPEPNPCRVQGVWEAPESEAVNLRQNHHGVSVREISRASQSTYSRDTRELEDTEDEESCNWTRSVEAGKISDAPVHQLLEINGNLASPSNTYSQDIDDSSLSSAAGLALWDCAPGKEYLATSGLDHTSRPASTDYLINGSRDVTTMEDPTQGSSELSVLHESLSWDSIEDSIIQTASGLGELMQQAPKRDAKTKAFSVESQSTQNFPSALQPASLRESTPTINLVPAESYTTAQGYNVTFVSTPQNQGVWESKENKGVTLRHNNHRVSVQEISVASQSSSSRDTRELEEIEEEESCAYPCPVQAVQMGAFPINLLLETSGNISSASKPFSQDADDSGLSSAARLVCGILSLERLYQLLGHTEMFASGPPYNTASGEDWILKGGTEPSPSSIPVSHILPGLPSPMPFTPGTNLSRRPTSTTPSLNYSSRSTSTRPELDHFSRPTSNKPCLNHLSRSTSTCQGLEHLSRPTSTTSGLELFSRPTSTITGLEHSSRPISYSFMYKITSRTMCHSTSSPDESLQEDLSLTIHKTSYWTGPADRQREAEDAFFISPVIQEMPEVQIRQGVQLKVSKGKIKGRSDLSSSCTGSMLHSCSSKETTISANSIWSKEFKLEQFLGQQMVLLKEEYVQFYWGLTWLHSESLVAHGDNMSPKLRAKMEEPFKKRLSEYEGQWPPKFQLSLDLGQAEVNRRTSHSAQANESSQYAQTVPSKGPEILQLRRTRHKDLQNYLGRALGKDTGARILLCPPQSASWEEPGTGIQLLDLGQNTQRRILAKSKVPERYWRVLTTHAGISRTPQVLTTQAGLRPHSVSSMGPEMLQPWRTPHKDLPNYLGCDDTSVSTPEYLVGRAWHRDTVVRSRAEYPETNPCQAQGAWKILESKAVTDLQVHLQDGAHYNQDTLLGQVLFVIKSKECPQEFQTAGTAVLTTRAGISRTPQVLTTQAGLRPHSVSSMGPEMLQPWRTPHKDLPNYLPASLRESTPTINLVPAESYTTAQGYNVTFVSTPQNQVVSATRSNRNIFVGSTL
ncbi:hypothetical protein ACRRTK_018040 [Alexandromys fortis]